MTLNKDAVVLTDELLKVLKAGGAVRTNIPLAKIRDGNNQRKGAGFSPEDMTRLTEDIRQKGLIKNLLVRQVCDETSPDEAFYEVLAGGRRIKAIRDLVDKDVEVKNQKTGKFARASQVYEYVPVLVEGLCDDDDAFSLTWGENDLHVPLSQADAIDACRLLEARGKTRKEMAALTGQSEAWLSHTLGFEKRLSASNYQKLRDGEITRTFAVKLMEFEPEVQDPIFEKAVAVAVERHEAEVEEVENELEEANREVQEAFDDKLKHARARRFDDAAKKLAENKLKNAKKKVSKSLVKKKKVESVVPVPNQDDLAEGAYRVTGSTVNSKTLTSSQVREYYVDRANTLLAIGDGADPIDIETGNLFLRRDLLLTVELTEAIANGRKDLTTVLRNFYRETGTWTATGEIDVKLVSERSVAVEEVDEPDDSSDDDEDDLIDDLDWDNEEPATRHAYSHLDLVGVGSDDED